MKLFSILFLIVICISSCSASAIEETEEPNNKLECKDIYTSSSNTTYEPPCFDILADQYLPEGYKLSILAAINEWAEQTHFTVHYSLRFIDMSQEPKDLKTKHTIRIYLEDPGPQYVGWSEWITDNQSATILVEPAMSNNDFRKVMLHELGHVFDLRFDNDVHYLGPCPSVMHPSIGNDSEHLECPELRAFCNNYSCSTRCN